MRKYVCDKKTRSLTGFTPLEYESPYKSDQRDNGGDRLLGGTTVKRTRSLTGFTLIELVLVILVIGVLATLSARFLAHNLDTNRYDSILAEMREIKRALIGDEHVIRGNQRVDFGYFGDNGAFPANLAQLAGYFAPSADFQNDAWGNAYNYSTGATITVTSYAANEAAGGSGLAEDVVLAINRDLYTQNVVYVMVYDARGNILRGDDTGDDLFQIRQLELERIASVAWLATTSTVVENTFYAFSGVTAGRYYLRVFPANGGGGASGAKDWRAWLNPDATTADAEIEQEIVVYPKGNMRPQIIPIRFPGAVNTYELTH